MDILAIAESQLGTREGPGGTSKYGTWLDREAATHDYADADWCGAFQLWCIAQGGDDWTTAAGGLKPAYALVQVWYDWMHAHDRISRTALPRRLVWYDWYGTPTGANHIGMVKSVSGGRMKVYEGNHNNTVELVDRPIDGQVMGFGEWWSFVQPPVAGDLWFMART